MCRRLSIGVLVLLPFAGCFQSARVDELSCTTDKFCPDGYVCVAPPTGAPGKCQKAADAGRSDGIAAIDGTTSRDVQTSPDADAATDQAALPDSPVGPDAAGPSLDLGPDVSTANPDAPDGAVNALDLGPDVGRDVAADLDRDLGPDSGPDVTPDLPYSPEDGSDVPPTSCVIGGTTYANGAANPSNSCQTCQTASELTSWTSSANGANCGTGQVCSGGTCHSGCWIDGTLVSSGNANPANTCQTCKPASSVSGWSTSADSTPCGTGKACSAGTCQCTTGTDCGASGCLDVNGNDINHCGSCTKACVAGQGCSLGICSCTKGAPACGGCLAWDFEWGANPSPWSLESSAGATSPNGATNIGITQSKHNGGASSLIAPILIDGGNTHLAEVTVSLPCKTNLSGYSGWAYVYFAGDYPLTDFSNQLVVDTWSSSGTAGDHVVPYFGNIPTNAWFKLDLGFLSSVQVDRIGIILTPTSNWTGTMYVDDVVINGL
jgi:hypothetical protein